MATTDMQKLSRPEQPGLLRKDETLSTGTTAVLPSARLDEFKNLWDRELTQKEIAKRMKIDPKTAKVLRDRLGLKKRYIYRERKEGARSYEYMRAYRRGLTDREIAERNDVTKWAIMKWREKKDLKPNKPDRTFDGVKPNVFRQYHRYGWTDSRLAKKFDMKLHRARKIRERLGLPSNHKPAFTEEGFMEAYAKSGSDYEIAGKLKVTKKIIRKWRGRLQLPAKGAVAAGTFTAAQYLSEWLRGSSDNHAAEALNVSGSTIQRFRVGLGLGANGRFPRNQHTSAIDRRIFRKLYDELKTDSEIAEVLGTSATRIRVFRNSLKLTPNGRLHNIKIPSDTEILDLWNKGAIPSKIAGALESDPLYVSIRLKEMQKDPNFNWNIGAPPTTERGKGKERRKKIRLMEQLR